MLSGMSSSRIPHTPEDLNIVRDREVTQINTILQNAYSIGSSFGISFGNELSIYFRNSLGYKYPGNTLLIQVLIKRDDIPASTHTGYMS